MSNQSKKAIIYCRCACIEQADFISAIAQQETECRLYAARHHYEVIQAFHDDHRSGLTIHRPAFKLMLITLLAAQESYAIIVTAMDKIARDVNDFAAVCKIFAGLGCELLFAEDDDNGRGA